MWTKKKISLVKTLIALLILACIVSCGKKDVGDNAAKNFTLQINGVKNSSTSSENSFADLEDFFTPNYTPCIPEEPKQSM